MRGRHSVLTVSGQWEASLSQLLCSGHSHRLVQTADVVIVTSSEQHTSAAWVKCQNIASVIRSLQNNLQLPIETSAENIYKNVTREQSTLLSELQGHVLLECSVLHAVPCSASLNTTVTQDTWWWAQLLSCTCTQQYQSGDGSTNVPV